MAEPTPGTSPSITRLIFFPSLITLAITLLRLVGELKHWPSPWFNASAGGGGAIVGISWLPFVLGPYFALKLAEAGEAPSGPGKIIGLSLAGLAVSALGGYLVLLTEDHPSALTIVGFVVMLIAAFVPRPAWRALSNTLLAYAFAARIPVLIVMFFAMCANDGQGWGTHYDVVPPSFAHAGLGRKFFAFAFMPQMCSWIGYTVIVGSLLGGALAAIVRRKPATQPAT